MPILNILAAQGTHHPDVAYACAACLKENTVNASALTLGVGQSPHAIALPPCSCGAQEFLQRTFDVHPVEREAGHRLAVNALAEHLKSNGRIHSAHMDAVAAAPTPPQVGRLLGAVPDSSLPARIVAARRTKPKSVPAPDAIAAAKAVLEAAKAAYAKAVGAAS
jgi:hypothetical protein